MKDLKQNLLNGETIELQNENDFVVIWFTKTWNCFCLELNSQVITTKTFNPIVKKLEEIGNLEITSN
tara:strand:- start:1416 stop:1616 length:201 start_codon:yes stop_codon:yes gene_type:complete